MLEVKHMTKLVDCRLMKIYEVLAAPLETNKVID